MNEKQIVQDDVNNVCQLSKPVIVVF